MTPVCPFCQPLQYISKQRGWFAEPSKAIELTLYLRGRPPMSISDTKVLDMKVPSSNEDGIQRKTALQNSPGSQVSIAKSISRHSLFNVEKSLVANLLEEAIDLLDRDRPVARKRIEEAFALVRSNGDVDTVQTSKLARWQLTQPNFRSQHLGSRLRIGAVKSVNLSPSHFSRAFKATRGVSFTSTSEFQGLNMQNSFTENENRPSLKSPSVVVWPTNRISRVCSCRLLEARHGRGVPEGSLTSSRPRACGWMFDMLELRPGCECCDKDLPPQATDAMICTFECTFCRNCSDTILRGVFPNCGGNLVARPNRPPEKLAQFPASMKRVVREGGCGIVD